MAVFILEQYDKTLLYQARGGILQTWHFKHPNLNNEMDTYVIAHLKFCQFTPGTKEANNSITNTSKTSVIR